MVLRILNLPIIDEGAWPPANPNLLAQQEAMSKLWPMGMQGFGGMFGGAGGAPVGGAAAPGQAQGEQVQAEEKKEEIKAEVRN